MISDAAVEHLLHEDLFVWVFEVYQKVVGMGVNSANYWVESFYALVALFDELGELHFQL